MRSLSCSFLLIAFLALSCHHFTNGSDAARPDAVPDSLAEKVMGVYSGNFNKGIITLNLNYISGKNVSGYDMHKGLRRNINGTVSSDGGLLQFVLKEPGDNPFDGTFRFSLDTTSFKIDGQWVAIDSAKVKPRKLLLSRKIDSLMETNTWATEATYDTSLTFKKDGSCEYEFYERPADSTSQLITIRGNYEKKVDTFRIEWEKNSHTPAQSMKLVEKHITHRTDSGEEYESVALLGHGLRLVIFEGD
jgi:hypothetical protein